MSVSLVVVRLEIADQSPPPRGFQYCAVEGMSEEQLQEKALGLAKLSLNGKSELERAAVLHQHIGSRAMGDMVIETFEAADGSARDAHTEPESLGGAEPSPVDSAAKGTAPDSPSKQLPDQISFFSGNPSVEIVHGIMHLYKTNKMTSLTEDVRRSAMVCILTVPATMTSHDLMQLMAPFNEVMEHMKIIRDSTPNQYMVLIKFCSQADADSFYTTCNGRQFNSIEEAVCQVVYVERAEVIKSQEGASLPVMELTELPKCTVCLERMDESVNGVLTTLCNHSFHSQCLQRWEDASCPVCRYCQTPEPVEENKCFECGVQENLWICLICGHIGCGRYVSRHAYKHFEETQHTYAMQLTNHRVWDYAGDNYVHRLVASKTDGKMVQFECEGDTCQEEKVDGLQLEVCTFCSLVPAESPKSLSTQLSGRVLKLSQELKEEQEMNRCLRANQAQLQAQLAEEERERKDAVIAELQEQLRDVMFYLETQQKIEQLSSEARSEIQDGQIDIPAGPADSAAAGPSSGRGRRGRGRKRK
uniref:BRCA1-associated protein n=1 Tax=Oryzias latipes TaxID=8090 RepID=H2L4F3_ORYLA